MERKGSKNEAGRGKIKEIRVLWRHKIEKELPFSISFKGNNFDLQMLSIDLIVLNTYSS